MRKIQPFRNDGSATITWTDALVRLGIDDVTEGAPPIQGLAAYLETVLGILLQVADVNLGLFGAQHRFVHGIHLRFGEPPDLVVLDRRVAVHGLVPHQVHLLVGDGDHSAKLDKRKI